MRISAFSSVLQSDISGALLLTAHAQRSVTVRSLPIITLALLLGCASMQHYDPRLNGTWRLDPPTNWVSGEMVLTFSNGWDRISLGDGTGPFRPYRAIERGTNFVVIEHLFYPHARVRFDFDATGEAFWLPQSTGSSLRFARATEADGSADGVQPSSSSGNRRAGAGVPHPRPMR
jgi:hypothetical protein